MTPVVPTTVEDETVTMQRIVHEDEVAVNNVLVLVGSKKANYQRSQPTQVHNWSCRYKFLIAYH